MKTISLPPHSLMLRENFIFGVATSSYQIEGDRAGRETCNWDLFCQQEGTIADSADGDVACEHVRHWAADVELISYLGVDAYRLSLSWSRVMRDDGTVNQPGLDFYIRLVDALNEKGLKVFATLYHWDLPAYLDKKGGWLNRNTALAFAHYAQVVTAALGNRVYAWATLNEPFCSAYLGYETGIHAPGLTERKAGRQAAHHLLLAHGLAIQVMRKNRVSSKLGIVLNFSTCLASTGHPDDARAARQADEYLYQWYLKPVLEGAYPDVIHALPEDEKPYIEPQDMHLIRQPLDYLGINYYSPTLFQDDGYGWFRCVPPRNVPVTDMGWEINPQAFTTLLVSLDKQYALPPVYITENGAAMDDRLENDVVSDPERTAYFDSHLKAINDAMVAGVDICGYFAWSLMDNFEWSFGYSKRFGLVYVDYATQKRIVKQSGLAYRDFLRSRSASQRSA